MLRTGSLTTVDNTCGVTTACGLTPKSNRKPYYVVEHISYLKPENIHTGRLGAGYGNRIIELNTVTEYGNKKRSGILDMIGQIR